jgi:beta-N-acetylhexosaminidase
MPANPSEAIEAVYDAVRTGEISEKKIDESLMRILKVKYKKGLI